jgi:3-isopropylmalate/(R)-2-methylmalate dehydratase small subunit
MRVELEGRAHVLGDDVNTDYIISSSRKKETIDPDALKKYLLENIDPAFAERIQPGDLLVAGKNFGCGSAMEVAVTVLLAAGIHAVLARSFSRTYFRNAINNGLIAVECDTSTIRDGNEIRLVLDSRETRVFDVTGRMEYAGLPFPGIMLDVLSEGGIVPYMRNFRDFKG